MQLRDYELYLKRHGRNLAEVKKNQSDVIINKTFTRDPNYKRVYILTPEGWKYEDAKYQTHSTPSIIKDAVDYYLQFRPKVHYPVGTYVIIPDDTDFDINLTKEQMDNPFSQPVPQRTQWWFIVGRDDARSYVRYSILKCNYEFKWLWKGNIMRCYGAVRGANSYTSGKWVSEISAALDNVINAWMPDVMYTYGGEAMRELGLDNNQTITYDMRFMITYSDYEPKCYQVTKANDVVPRGLIKFTLKQDDFNINRDNPQLGICDYYSEEGNILANIEPSDNPEDITSMVSSIMRKDLDANGELIDSSSGSYLDKGVNSYFEVHFTNEGSDTVVDPEWHITLINDSNYTEDEVKYYVDLLAVTEFDDSIVSIKPRKAGSLSGKKYKLSVSDKNGNYYSSIDLEVR